MKRLCSLLTIALLSIGAVCAQDNLILNGDFEIGSPNFLFGAQFEDWTFNGGEIAIETTDVYDGEQAFRTVNIKQATASLSQSVDLQTDVTGQAFVLTIHYKVIDASEGDLSLNSAWEYYRPTEGQHDSATLNQTLPIGEGWQEFSVTTTKPQNANSFRVSVQVKKGMKVLFDGFSLTREAKTIPWFTVSPESINSVSTNVGEEKLMATLTIRQGNTTKPVSLWLSGTNKGMFRIDKEEVTEAEEQVALYYTPTAAGSHKAYLMVESPEATQDFKSISLSASANDPTQKPELTISPNSIPHFTTTVGSTVSNTIQVSSLNCTEDITVTILNDNEPSAFVISSTLIPKNMEAQTVITFRPTKVGEYSATIYWSTAGAQKQQIKVTGTATPSSENPDKDWATEFKWDMSKPYTLLNEHFDQATHNKTLVLKDWQNVVKKGDRPWWGFDDKENDVVVEHCAKATAYIYQEPDATPLEMWLVTPALDYRNAGARTFTFRVRGDYLSDEQSADLQVYYIDATEPNDIFFQDLQIAVPRTADESGDWIDLHINLAGQENIADVFFMAFRFTGNSGQEGAATYLIDDVSWGRTDLPAITTDSVSIIMTTNPNAIKAVGVTVEGKNLTEPISVTKAGANPSSFTITPTELPAEGGILAVGFQSAELGVHEAYLRLRSRGAVDVFIPMAVLVTQGQGIEKTTQETTKAHLSVQDGSVVVVTPEGTYNLLGVKLQ